MGRIVRPDDFTDAELKAFVAQIERLDYTVRGTPEPDLLKAADDFAKPLPRPSPAELRDCLGHAVQEAMGWDDPDQPDKMLHSALKLYYILKWLDHVHPRGSKSSVYSQALRVAFTPVFSIKDPKK